MWSMLVDFFKAEWPWIIATECLLMLILQEISMTPVRSAWSWNIGKLELHYQTFCLCCLHATATFYIVNVNRLCLFWCWKSAFLAQGRVYIRMYSPYLFLILCHIVVICTNKRTNQHFSVDSRELLKHVVFSLSCCSTEWFTWIQL